jgi:predicted lipoprotein with Yx(FWY)xxD motif
LRRTSILVLSLLALGGVFASGAAAASPKPTLQLLKTHRYGNILIAGNGYMTYGFSIDKPGKDVCQNIPQCLHVWPPVLAPHKLVLGRGVKRSLVHSIRLKSGKRQLTYNGWPLYTYIADTRPKQTSNINTVGFGASWPAVNAAGKFVPAS